MSSNRITVRVPENLTARLRNRSRARGTTESKLVREALENYLKEPATSISAYDMAKEAGVVGGIVGAPRDLSTNRRYFSGFGKNQ